MPQIAEVTAPSDIINPSAMNRGEEALAQSGRIASMYGRESESNLRQAGEQVKQVADVYDQHLTMEQVSNGSTTAMKMEMDMNNEWNGMLKDGSAETPANVQAFQQKWTQQRQQWMDSFSTTHGKEWALNHTERWSESWQHKLVSDVSTLAGQRVVQNDNTMVTLGSHNAYEDPSSTSRYIQDYKSSLDMTLNDPNIGGKEAAVIRTHAEEQVGKIAYAGGLSAASKGGNWRMAIGDAGQYVTGEQAAQLDRMVSTAGERQKTEMRATIQDQKRGVEAQIDDGLNKAFAKDVITSPDGTTTISPDYFKNIQNLGNLAMQNPGLGVDPAKLRSAYNWGQAEVKRAAEGTPSITDQPTKDALLKNIGAPNAEVSILQAATKGQLSSKDTTQMRELAKAIQTQVEGNPYTKGTVEEALKAAGAQLHGTTQPGDPGYVVGEAAMARYRASFYPALLNGLASGKSVQDVLYGADGIASPAKIGAFLPNGDDLMRGLGSYKDREKAIESLPSGGQAPVQGNPSGGQAPAQGNPASRPPLGSFFGGSKFAPAPVPPPQGERQPPQVPST